MSAIALTCLAAVSGCGTPGKNVPVVVPDAEGLTPRQEVTREVGHLLRPEEDVSREAERRLLLLDEGGRRELVRVAAEMPRERDPRWLHVLDENGMLPELTEDERLEFLLWKASRRGDFFAAKAQSSLVDVARQDPDRLIRRLGRSARDAETIGTALAVARVERAIPALVDAYVAARDVEERRAVAEALAILAGEVRRPRVTGTPEDFRRDAERIRGWWATGGGASGG